tara:strand:+ start:646 stop:1029 length:384 start_codon:yes stop_codon:yes gene_type:complete
MKYLKRIYNNIKWFIRYDLSNIDVLIDDINNSIDDKYGYDDVIGCIDDNVDVSIAEYNLESIKNNVKILLENNELLMAKYNNTNDSYNTRDLINSVMERDFIVNEVIKSIIHRLESTNNVVLNNDNV